MVAATATTQYSPYFPNLTNPPQNPLQYVSNPTSQGGLGITVHYIGNNQTFKCGTKPPLSAYDRCVTTTPVQQAVRVTESLDTSVTNPLGLSSTGTPNGPDQSTVYTQRINNFIRTACGTLYGTSNCADPSGVFDNYNTATGTNDYALTLKYIKHTIDHEVAHLLGPLYPIFNATLGGYHTAPETGVIMDQSIAYTGPIGGKVTFHYIGTTYTSVDQSGAHLK
jgi:hypothetical protein